MAEQVLRIRLGVAADPSLKAGFKLYEDAALKAARAVRNEAARTASAQARAEQAAATEKQKALAHVARVRDNYFREQQRNEERAVRQSAATQARAARQIQVAKARELAAETRAHDRVEREKVRTTERNEAYRRRVQTASLAAEQRLRERADRERERSDQQSESRRRRFGRDMGGAFLRDSGRLVGHVARAGIGFGRSAAQGFGIDTSLAGNIASSIDSHDAARRITQSGLAAEGKTVTAAEIQKTFDAVSAAADKMGIKVGDLALGLEDFVSNSGDLEGGKKMLERLTEIAQANGADAKDIVGLGGSAYRYMSGANREEDALRVVSGFAMQGAMGNVELKDTGVYAARYLASASKAKGDIATNALQLGALGQLAMEGGRVDAAEATGSAASLFSDLLRGRTQKNWDDTFGTKDTIWADPGKNTELRSAFDLATSAVEKTGGDMSKLVKLFPNQKSFAPMAALADKYNEAGGGEAGSQAMRAALERFMKPQSREWITSSAQAAQTGPKADAARFSNEMEKVGTSLAHELAPAVRELTPLIKEGAKMFGGFIQSIKNNPGTAIGAALSALILKSGAEAVIKDGFTNLFAGAKGGGAGAGSPIAVAVVLWTAGKLAVDFGFEQADQAERSQRGDLIGAGNAISYATGLRERIRAGEKVSDQEKQKALKGLGDARSDLQQRVLAAGPQSTGDKVKEGLGWIFTPGAMLGTKMSRQGQDQAQNEANFVKNSAEISRLNANIDLLTQTLSGNLTVTVANASEIRGAPGRDPDVE